MTFGQLILGIGLFLLFVAFAYPFYLSHRKLPPFNIVEFESAFTDSSRITFRIQYRDITCHLGEGDKEIIVNRLLEETRHFLITQGTAVNITSVTAGLQTYLARRFHKDLQFDVLILKYIPVSPKPPDQFTILGS